MKYNADQQRIFLLSLFILKGEESFCSLVILVIPY